MTRNISPEAARKLINGAYVRARVVNQDRADATVDVGLLRKGLEFVETEAAKPTRKRKWFQQRWIFSQEQARDGHYGVTEGIRARTNHCGTLYCFAGYIASLEHDDETLVNAEMGVGSRAEESLHPSRVARRNLNIPESVAHELFHAENSSKDIRNICEAIADEKL